MAASDALSVQFVMPELRIGNVAAYRELVFVLGGADSLLFTLWSSKSVAKKNSKQCQACNGKR